LFLIGLSYSTRIVFSVGKSTVINALLRGHYSPTSVRRETAGITKFRINVVAEKGKRKSTGDGKRKARTLDDDNDDSEIVDLCEDGSRTAESIHDEAKEENERLRKSETLEEPTVVDIHLDCFLGEMRNDTSLCLVDIPGVNDIKMKPVYKKWVNDNWSSFDCVILVMDATHGVDTADPVDLLTLVETNCRKIRDLPVIILCNKVDDPCNEELDKAVSCIQKEIQEIFNVDDRKVALEEFLEKRNNGELVQFPSPAFLPISAQYALLYHSANGGTLGLDEFKGFPFHLIDKFGLDEVGKHKWKSLKTKDEKYEKAYEELQDPGLFKERLQATNFDKVTELLSFTICGCDVQTQLIGAQLDFAMSTSAKHSVMDVLRVIHKKKVAIGAPIDTLPPFFWKAYKECEDDAFAELIGPGDVKCLEPPMTLLIDYHRFATDVKCPEEAQAMVEKLVALVRRQINWVMDLVDDHERSASGAFGAVRHSSRRESRITWESISLDDWTTILDSILLLSCDRSFCEEFGKEQIDMQKVVRKISYMQAGRAAACVTAPMVTVPESPADKDHWGHLIWMFCNFREEVAGEAAEE
jgi:signal recognition particle receptor subunit beta